MANLYRLRRRGINLKPCEYPEPKEYIVSKPIEKPAEKTIKITYKRKKQPKNCD